MHSTTAVLHAQPFTLGYPPSSSASDCIGSQQPPRFFSPSAAFNPSDEDSHSRRIGFLGQSLQDPNTITSPTTGLAYSPRTPGVQDVAFGSSSGGLFMTPTDGTTTESLLSIPRSLYQRSSASWQRGMAGFSSSETRIPSILPAVNPIVSLQGGGHSLGGNTLMARDNNYPNGYHSLSRQTYASPSAPLHDSYRYSYSSDIPQGTGTSLGDPYSLLHSQRGSHSQPEAPPFCVTESIDRIVGSNHQEVTPIIHAKIQKGFFQSENKWTCYRRNYFSVSCSFSLQPLLHHGSYFYQAHGQPRPEPIVKWGMSISAMVNNTENETRELVQHTPKRDRKSEKTPEMVQLRPMPMTSNVVGSGSHSPLYETAQQMEFNSYPMQQAQPPPSQHTFERIQFQKATANNGKRRAQQQFYNLIVELHVLVGSHLGQQQWKMVARRISEPMVVRGRSPGHYKKERRHSSASMGDSGGRGGSTGGGGGGDGGGDAGRSLMSSSMDHHQQHQQQSYSSSSQMQFLFDSSSQRGDPSHYGYSRDLSRHDSYQNFGQTTNHCVEAISPLVSTSDGSIDFTFPDALASTHESADSTGGGGGDMGGNRGLSHMSHYSNRHDVIHGENEDSCFRRDSGSSGSSCRQSHVPSLDLSSSSRTLDDAFDPMIVSYPSDEHEDASEQYSKQSTAESCLLTSIVNDNNTQCTGNNHNSSLTAGSGSGGATRSSGTPFSRLIDPSQESLCV